MLHHFPNTTRQQTLTTRNESSTFLPFDTTGSGSSILMTAMAYQTRLGHTISLSLYFLKVAGYLCTISHIFHMYWPRPDILDVSSLSLHFLCWSVFIRFGSGG